MLKNKLLLFFFLLGMFTNISAQNINDFRSINSGNWTTATNWERFDGTNWVTATYYPGNGPTNDINIINGNTITINSPISISVNSITIGDNDDTNIETLEVNSNATIFTNTFLIKLDGLLKWISFVTLTLSNDNTELIVENTLPDDPSLGSTHGIYINPPPCSKNQTLEIGTARKNIYATCNGGGGSSVESFNEVNNSGGNQSLTVTIVPSVTELCSGETISFTAYPSGTAYNSGNTTTYNWTSTPTTGNITNTNSDTTSASPTTDGSITYQINITHSGYNASNSVTITVNNCNQPSGKIITNRRITYRVNK